MGDLLFRCAAQVMWNTAKNSFETFSSFQPGEGPSKGFLNDRDCETLPKVGCVLWLLVFGATIIITRISISPAPILRPAAVVVLEVEVDNQQSWLHCPIRELGTNLLQT